MSGFRTSPRLIAGYYYIETVRAYGRESWSESIILKSSIIENLAAIPSTAQSDPGSENYGVAT